MSRHRSHTLTIPLADAVRAVNHFNEGVRRDMAEMPPTDDLLEKTIRARMLRAAEPIPEKPC